MVWRVLLQARIVLSRAQQQQWHVVCIRPTRWQRFISDKLTGNEAVKNVLLYHNPLSRPRFFLIISIAAGIQLVFWTYLSYVALTEYYQVKPRANKNKDVNELVSSDNSLQNILQSKAKSIKWRVGLSLLAMTVGTFFTFTALMYPLRTVHRILFYRGRQSMELTTYTPLGGLHKTEVPVTSLTRIGSAQQSSNSSYLAVKVKGHPLFYLMDRRESFLNHQLFDTLIGTRL